MSLFCSPLLFMSSIVALIELIKPSDAIGDSIFTFLVETSPLDLSKTDSSSPAGVEILSNPVDES